MWDCLTLISDFITNPKVVNSAGLIFDILGARFVASEVVDQYKGVQFGGITLDNADGLAKPTKDFTIWEKTKLTRMKLGLRCLTLGFILQIISNCI